MRETVMSSKPDSRIANSVESVSTKLLLSKADNEKIQITIGKNEASIPAEIVRIIRVFS